MREKFSRYVFTFLESIDASTLAKLNAKTDKVFIFLPHDTVSIPVSLVSIAQKKGKNLKWVPTAGEGTMQSTLSFSLGVWHERAPIEIEFVVASNEESLDPFIEFINAVGRKCLRVQVNEIRASKVLAHDKLDTVNGINIENVKVTSGLSIDDLKHISIGK